MTFVIAEAGSNWNRDPKLAKKMIDVAAEAGADAVKFQVFRGKTVYASGAGSCPHLVEKGMPQEIQEVFKALEMPYELIPELAQRCERRGIEFMASFFSPDDFWAVDPYVRRHKIASPELHDPRLLQLAAESGKPVYLSTGMSTPEEIEWALGHFDGEVILMQCTVQYPAQPESVNLRAMVGLGKKYGLSDHTRDPVIAPVAAVALGASVIEKHFTLDRTSIGPDHSWAITGEELAEMVGAIRCAEKMLGSRYKTVVTGEAPLRRFSLRRIHAVCPIAKGERYGDNIAVLRSGHQTPGLHPRWLKMLDGKIATRDISIGEGIQQGDWM